MALPISDANANWWDSEAEKLKKPLKDFSTAAYLIDFMELRHTAPGHHASSCLLVDAIDETAQPAPNPLGGSPGKNAG